MHYTCETSGTNRQTRKGNARRHAKVLFTVDIVVRQNHVTLTWTCAQLKVMWIKLYKLLLFNRLCHAQRVYFYKQLFNLHVVQVLTGKCNELSITFEFIELLRKCDLLSFFENYLKHIFIPQKYSMENKCNSFFRHFRRK